MCGQVQCDAAQHVVAVLQVPEERHRRVHAHHQRHARVQHAVPAAELAGLGHLVLEREDLPGRGGGVS